MQYYFYASFSPVTPGIIHCIITTSWCKNICLIVWSCYSYQSLLMSLVPMQVLWEAYSAELRRCWCSPLQWQTLEKDMGETSLKTTLWWPLNPFHCVNVLRAFDVAGINLLFGINPLTAESAWHSMSPPFLLVETPRPPETSPIF
jgi:hypothetical protein